MELHCVCTPYTVGKIPNLKKMINGHTNSVLSITVYEAGKAVKAGVPSQYAASMFAPSVYGQPVYLGGPSPPIPMLPMPQGVNAPPSNGYGRDFDVASSGG